MSLLDRIRSALSRGLPPHRPVSACHPTAPGFTLDAPYLVWIVAQLAKCHRLPCDPAQVLRDCPPPCTFHDLRRTLAELGLTLREVRASDRAVESSDPMLVLSRAAGDDPQCRIGVARRAGEDYVRLHTPDSAGYAHFKRDVFREQWAGAWFVVSREDPGTGEDEPTKTRARPFGFHSFIPDVLRHRTLWRDVLVASAAIQLLALGVPLFTQIVIDKVVVHQTRSTLAVVTVALAAFVLFSGVMTWVRQYLVAHTGNRIDAAIGSRAFAHLLRLPPRFFERRPTGTVISRLQGVETIREFVSGAAVTLLLDLPFLVFFLAIMLWYSAALTAVALGFLALLVIASVVVTPALRARLDQQFLVGARNQALVTEYVAGMATVKTLQMEPVVQRRYENTLAQSLAASFRTRTLGNTYHVTATTLEQAMGVAILAVGATLVMDTPGFTVGMLVAFQMFASRMAQPLLRLTGLWQEFQRARVAVARLGDLMDAPGESYRAAPVLPAEAEGELVLDGVSFRHGDDRPWLFRDVDLRLPQGGVTLLVGPSGVGKSTLTRLILGFESPGEGRIRLGERDLASLAVNERRALFGVVPQETVLFAGTIRDNLAVASPHATFEDLVMACRLAGVHDDIARMPDGYDTTVGERGVGLSGGQRQRLAIARALLKRPRFLVFDEATSHLDAATAEAFVRTVNALRGQATILFIAHAVPRGLAVDQIARLGPDGLRTVASADRPVGAARESLQS
jgi:subfamily B ATP-binding cassette protein HlyB/CyaB